LRKILLPKKKLKLAKTVRNKPKLVLVNSDHCLENNNQKLNDIVSTGMFNPLDGENFNDIKEKSF
jgi:hypothetical protein